MKGGIGCGKRKRIYTFVVLFCGKGLAKAFFACYTF